MTMPKRHAHKGPETRRAALRNIPFLSMSPKEFEETFDDTSIDLDREILREGREGRCELVIAAVLLHAPGKPDRLVSYVAEYGDGEGEDMMLRFARRYYRQKLLQPDESLSVRTYSVGLSAEPA